MTAFWLRCEWSLSTRTVWIWRNALSMNILLFIFISFLREAGGTYKHIVCLAELWEMQWNSISESSTNLFALVFWLLTCIFPFQTSIYLVFILIWFFVFLHFWTMIFLFCPFLGFLGFLVCWCVNYFFREGRSVGIVTRRQGSTRLWNPGLKASIDVMPTPADLSCWWLSARLQVTSNAV